MLCYGGSHPLTVQPDPFTFYPLVCIGGPMVIWLTHSMLLPAVIAISLHPHLMI